MEHSSSQISTINNIISTTVQVLSLAEASISFGGSKLFDFTHNLHTPILKYEINRGCELLKVFKGGSQIIRIDMTMSFSHVRCKGKWGTPGSPPYSDNPEWESIGNTISTASQKMLAPEKSPIMAMDRQVFNKKFARSNCFTSAQTCNSISIRVDEDVQSAAKSRAVFMEN